jgi:hypothetical protein
MEQTQSVHVSFVFTRMWTEHIVPSIMVATTRYAEEANCTRLLANSYHHPLVAIIDQRL